jgi:serine/threonine-protein kinase
MVLLGQFRLEEVVGSGAAGVVYRAWQTGMERPVAVKLLHPQLVDDQEKRERFLREARAAARLAHPNIVCVHLVAETPERVPYIVMEYLGGENLADLLEREGRLEPARAIAIARQIASALAEAHAGGVIHRDLKPENIAVVRGRGAGEPVTPQGSRSTAALRAATELPVKILDFGIAKLTDGALVSESQRRLTHEGAIFGTPHYIAPEQAQGAALDGRADLYGLGCLLYRMLSGRLPFDGHPVAVMLGHIGAVPPPLDALRPELPPDLVAITMRCLAKRPDDRFDSAEDLLAALERAAVAIRVSRGVSIWRRRRRELVVSGR